MGAALSPDIGGATVQRESLVVPLDFVATERPARRALSGDEIHLDHVAAEGWATLATAVEVASIDGAGHGLRSRRNAGAAGGQVVGLSTRRDLKFEGFGSIGGDEATSGRQPFS